MSKFFRCANYTTDITDGELVGRHLLKLNELTFHYLLYSKRSPRSSFNLSFMILAMPGLGYSNAFIDLENAIVILAMPGLGYANAFIDLENAIVISGFAFAILAIAIDFWLLAKLLALYLQLQRHHKETKQRLSRFD